MQCPNCEAENRDEAKFCDECGFPLSGSIARVAGAASPHVQRDASNRSRSSFEWMQLDETPDEPEFERHETTEDDYVNAPAPDFGIAQEFEDIDDFSASDGYEVVEQPRLDDAYEQATFDGLDASDRVIDDPLPDSAFEEPARSYDQEYAQAHTQSLDPALYDIDDYRVPSRQATSYRTRQREVPQDHTLEMPPVDREKSNQARDFRMTNTSKKRGKGKLVAFIIAGVVVGVILAAVVTFALGFWGGIEVPDVTGMTEADARNVLVDDGFTVRTSEVKSDDTEGLVLIMDPGAGQRAPEGSEVVIHIATARFVPDIVDKNVDDAKAALADAGYENIRYEMQKSDGEENIVLDVAPTAGTRAKSSTEIVVKVSEAYTVPSVEGLDIDAAMSAISNAGLTPEVVYIDTDQFPDGSIIGTNPEEGAKVSEGEYVSISVARARGVELVGLTEEMFAQGNTVTIGGVDYEIESIISVSYQGDDTVAFTASGRPKITFFGETLYASSSQTISGTIAWSEDNEVIGIY